MIREKKERRKTKDKECSLRSKNKVKMMKKVAKIVVATKSNVELSIKDIEMLKICSDTEEVKLSAQNV